MREALIFFSCISCVLLFLILKTPEVYGQEIEAPLPRHRLTYDAMSAGRYNGLGVSLEGDVRYRFRLHQSGNPIKKEAHIGVGFAPTVNPAHTRLGPVLVLQPLTVVSFKVGYFYNIWHGTFGHLQSYRFVEDEAFMADSDISSDEGEEGYVTTGHECLLSLNLLGALGPFVLSNTTSAVYTHQDLRGEDRLYYLPTYDILVANQGWMLSNDTDLVFLTTFGLIAGIRNSVIHAFYRDEHFQDGRKRDVDNTPSIMLGPLVAYSFFERPGALIDSPTVFLMLGWYLKHPFRAGQQVNQGVPAVTLGVAVNGDIWSRE